MKYVRTPGFLVDLRRLPDEHRKMFVDAVHQLLRPAPDAGAHTGAAPWPRTLRIHRIGRSYSMTWSFAGPDGRALFRLAEVAGEPVVVWQPRHLQPLTGSGTAVQLLAAQEREADPFTPACTERARTIT